MSEEPYKHFKLNIDTYVSIKPNILEIYVASDAVIRITSFRKFVFLSEITRVEYHKIQHGNRLSIHLRGDPNFSTPYIQIDNIVGIKAYRKSALEDVYVYLASQMGFNPDPEDLE